MKSDRQAGGGIGAGGGARGGGQGQAAWLQDSGGARRPSPLLCHAGSHVTGPSH